MEKKDDNNLTNKQRLFCRARASGDTILQAMTIAFPSMKNKSTYYWQNFSDNQDIKREIAKLSKDIKNKITYRAAKRVQVAEKLLEEILASDDGSKTKRVRDILELLKYIGSMVRDKLEINIGTMLNDKDEPMSIKEKVEYFQMLYTSGKINEDDFEILRKSVFTAEENEFLERINKALEKK